MKNDYINIKGARIHNLKNLNLKIRKNTITAITGVSGSGKSSLAFDLLFEEGRFRYLQAIGLPPRIISEKQFDEISGLSPTVAVEQRTVRFRNPRSTVGTRTGIYNYLRMLFASEALVLCPNCKTRVKGKMCNKCKTQLTQLEIKHFSFNEPSGMCLHCTGRGYVREFKVHKIVPDPEKTLYEICVAAKTVFADMRNFIYSLAKHYNFHPDTPYKELPQKIKHIFLHGSGDDEIEFELKSKNYTHKTKRAFEGVIPHMERTLEKGISSHRHRKIEEVYMEKVVCPKCNGREITVK